jgi:hypothetical protein
MYILYEGHYPMLHMFALASLAIFIVLSGCNNQDSNENERLFVVRVADERFVIKLVTKEQIEVAEAMLEGRIPQKIVVGTLADGNGGFNHDPLSGRNWSWHLIPETVSFADQAIELCDGKPSYIEENKEYWLETVKQFCPWDSQIESELSQ